MSVTEIEMAIRQLSVSERCELLETLVALDDDEWDKQMEEDAKSGRLDKWLDEVRKEHEAGLSKPL